jgi:precorrin-2/cobalt-factor-2 C20-methyltransferase
MTLGTFYGIGVGPGDPELITLNGKHVIERARYVFVPKARSKSESIALAIAQKHISRFAAVQELVFPMVTDTVALEEHWRTGARVVADVLRAGKDAVFLTLGDALLYSTHIYLVRALKKALPDLKIITVPGIAAFSATAALTGFPVGEGKHPVVIIPTSDDLSAIDRAVVFGGTVVLMKVGKRLGGILDLLASRELLERSVFVARAGLDGERIETDLGRLEVEDPHLGYLSTIIIDARKESVP